MQSKIKKFLVGVTLLSIIIQSTGANFFVSPKAFAEDEVSPVPTVVQDSPVLTEAPTASPTSSDITPIPAQDSTVATPEVLVMPKEEVSQPPSDISEDAISPTPATVDNLSPPSAIENSPESAVSAQLAPAVWQTADDGKATTINNVVLGQTYSAPQNDKVKITFTKLPDPSDKLIVSEVKLSSEQQEELSAVSDTAYEFTSPMADGTFAYNLTLPVPANVNKDEVVVKSAESTEDLGNAQTLGEPKEVATDTITIKGLTHFTVFVLVNDVNGDNAVDATDDIANGVLVAIDDTWAEQNNADANKGGGDELHVRSKTDENKRTFVKFDTSAIPAGSEITKATLRLFMFDAPPSSRDYEARLVVEGWDEDTLAWNSQPADTGAATDTTSTGTSNNVWRQWDVTGDVQAFVNDELANYGWAIRDSAEDSGTAKLGKFRSSDQGNELRRPQLIVDFAAPSDQPTDYKSPIAEEASGGNGLENNPEGAFDDGGSVASHTNNAAGESHIFYNYNPFEIPDGSTIRGIEVRTDWRLDATGGENSLDVELSWNGGDDWTGAKSDITETNKEHVASLGGAADTWDREWTADEFTNENFRVRATMNSTNAGRDFFLDWIPVRVYYTADTTPPVSTIDSPEEGSFWNIPIEISGSSTDEPATTVDYVNFYYRTSGEEENPWIEIPDSQQNNDPFEWSFNWTPDTEGTFDIKAEATDMAGNTENSPVVEYVTYDVSAPLVSTPSASPDPTNHPPQILADAVDAISNIVSAIFSVDDPDFIFAKPLEALDGFFDSLAETLFGPEFTNGMDYPGEGEHTLYVGAFDAAGNFGSNSAPFTVDTTAPTLESAETQDTNGNGKIDAIKLTFSENIDDSRLDPGNPDGWDVDDPYSGEAIGTGEGENDNILLLTFSEGESFDTGATPTVTYTPSGGGDLDPRSTHDAVGNELEDGEWSTSDGAPPLIPVADPAAGDYFSDQSVTLTSNDDGGTGLEGIYYTTDGSTPDNSSTPYTDPIAIGVDTTLKAIAYDNAGNPSDVLTAEYGIAPVISDETSGSVTDTSVTITWITDDPATSRVLYDSVSHPSLGGAPNYGYANSTDEEDADPKVTSHSVDISGLTSGTTYFYRTVSHGSPEAVGDEKSVTTTSPATTSGGGGGDGQSDGLGCGSKDCSGNVVGVPQVLGALISPLATGFAPEVLGETTPEAQLSPVPTQGVLGEEKNAPEEKPLITINKGFGWKKMTATALVIIFAIFLFWFLRRRHKKEGL
ncbi:MAG: hypothetical protein A2629_00345 [Candidatus Levybacteria bacterium RIFCSPHIGHO2_01_FULL_41_15]|nr:MAG: hypothetical protein A2629_00345 [Candidatus Levybacteria bacterium RIFCSPHIGHO2_01_FULL_41_15]